MRRSNHIKIEPRGAGTAKTGSAVRAAEECHDHHYSGRYWRHGHVGQLSAGEIDDVSWQPLDSRSQLRRRQSSFVQFRAQFITTVAQRAANAYFMWTRFSAQSALQLARAARTLLSSARCSQVRLNFRGVGSARRLSSSAATQAPDAGAPAPDTQMPDLDQKLRLLVHSYPMQTAVTAAGVDVRDYRRCAKPFVAQHTARLPAEAKREIGGPAGVRQLLPFFLRFVQEHPFAPPHSQSANASSNSRHSSLSGVANRLGITERALSAVLDLRQPCVIHAHWIVPIFVSLVFRAILPSSLNKLHLRARSLSPRTDTSGFRLRAPCADESSFTLARRIQGASRALLACFFVATGSPSNFNRFASKTLPLSMHSRPPRRAFIADHCASSRGCATACCWLASPFTLQFVSRSGSVPATDCARRRMRSADWPGSRAHARLAAS